VAVSKTESMRPLLSVKNMQLEAVSMLLGLCGAGLLASPCAVMATTMHATYPRKVLRPANDAHRLFRELKFTDALSILEFPNLAAEYTRPNRSIATYYRYWAWISGLTLLGGHFIRAILFIC
jgi:hypothetical protein